MTPLEYMENELRKHCRNYEHEKARGVPQEMIDNILRKIYCYMAAVSALREVHHE